MANIDIKPQPTRIVEKPKIVEVPKVKRVVVHDLAARPGGTIKRADCHTIAHGTRFADVIAKYGWPREDDPYDYGGTLYYPLKHVKDQYCGVSFDNNRVDDIEVTF